MKMLSYIPLIAVEKVQARSAIDPHASKKDFIIVASNAGRFRDPDSIHQSYTASEENGDDSHSLPSQSSKHSSLFGGINISGFGNTMTSSKSGSESLSREIRLKAPDERLRACWVTLLQVSRNVAVDATLPESD